jgi:hypothetical protein
MRNDNGTDIPHQNAESFCSGLPHAGHAPWRLPEPQELSDHQSKTGRFDGYVGSATHFWTALLSQFEFDPITGGTNINGFNPETIKNKRYRALCVYSSGAAAPSSWTDPASSLMWSRDATETVTWQAASDYCKALVLEGLSGWRLPAVEEFASIYDPSVAGVSHSKGGLLTRGEEFWTQTPGADGEMLAFDFRDGSTPVIKTGGSSLGMFSARKAFCVRRR